jgi:A/G-specific adenine glycosylase
MEPSAQDLLAWYDRAARRLPWRGTADPYRIWVSEVKPSAAKSMES